MTRLRAQHQGGRVADPPGDGRGLVGETDRTLPFGLGDLDGEMGEDERQAEAVRVAHALPGRLEHRHTLGVALPRGR